MQALVNSGDIQEGLHEQSNDVQTFDFWKHKDEHLFFAKCLKQYFFYI